MTNLRVPLQWRDDRRNRRIHVKRNVLLSMLLTRVSSHKYTPYDIKLQSYVTTEKAAEADMSSTFFANVR